MSDTNRIEDTWKFGKNEVLIAEMSRMDVISAALHAHKKMYHFNKAYHYAIYKIATATTKEEEELHKRKKQKSDDRFLYFANKLELLEQRAKQLKFRIPDRFEDIKKLKDRIRELDKEKNEESITKETKERVKEPAS